MNLIFNTIVIVGLIIMLFIKPDLCMSTILSAGGKTVNLCISLLGIYAVWLGLLEILEASGLNKIVAKLLKPIIKFVFGEQNPKASEQIAINISSNMLGLGNASTPSGIKAIQFMDDGSGRINQGQTMLMIINSMSIQLIPTTIIGLRIANGSLNSSDIILPILIVSVLSTTLAIILVKLAFKFLKRKK